MNSSKDILSEHDEIEMLLPWYVTGKLEPDDTVRVDAYLATHADMQERLELIGKERNEALHLNKAGASQLSTTPEDFMARVLASQDDQAPGLWARFRHMMTVPASGAVGWVGAAAALTIFAQGAAIFLLAQPEPVQGYREASGVSQGVAAGTFVLVRFADTASAADIAGLLTDLDMAIIEGPRAGRLFKVRIGPAGLGKSERERLQAALSARPDLVTFVTETR